MVVSFLLLNFSNQDYRIYLIFLISLKFQNALSKKQMNKKQVKNNFLLFPKVYSRQIIY